METSLTWLETDKFTFLICPVFRLLVVSDRLAVEISRDIPLRHANRTINGTRGVSELQTTCGLQEQMSGTNLETGR